MIDGFTPFAGNDIAYVNGAFVPLSQASVSVLDRGFLFADGVYEVTAVLDGELIDKEGHLRRLRRSLNQLGMSLSLNDDDVLAFHHELLRRNQLEEGGIYLQITRGVAPRDFAFPPPDTPLTLVAFPLRKSLQKPGFLRDGLKVISLDDIRWRRRDIKTVGLLAQSMAKQAALEAGADEAWMVEEGFVTEGTSNNAFILSKENCLITRQLSNDILHGITRKAVLALAGQQNLEIEERPFTIAEAQQAKEAFVTSASTLVAPVVSVDGHPLGDGKPGAVSLLLRSLYLEAAKAEVKNAKAAEL